MGLHGNATLTVRNQFAILRNLRNIVDAGVSDAHLNKVKRALTSPQWRKGAERVLPFRYVAAARACPQMEPALDEALNEAIAGITPLPGKTVVLVDVSGSMDTPLSAKSDMNRATAAAALASIIHGDLRLFTFTDVLVEVPPRRGMAGVDAILRSQEHGGTELGGAISYVNANVPHDRLIVITDEQSASRVPDPVCSKAYMVNVASAKNGVGYGKWLHLDGWSDHIIRYIGAHEAG